VHHHPDNAADTDKRVDHYQPACSIVIAERIKKSLFFFVVIVPVVIGAVLVIVPVSMSVLVSVLVVCHSYMFLFILPLMRC
jgi:uncharacterized membrane protein